MKGYITFSATVFCGVCEASRILPEVTLTSATREARKAGWRFTQTAGWACPTHAEDVSIQEIISRWDK